MERAGSLLGKFLERKPTARKETPEAEQRPVVAANHGVRSQPQSQSSQSQPPQSKAPRPLLPPPSFTPPSYSVQNGDPPPQKRIYRPRRGGTSDFLAVKGILAKALAGKGLDKQVERYEFVLHWEEIVGAAIAEISKPECLLKRSLVVRVTHSAWAQELAFMKPVILAKLAPFLKRGDVVDDIIFKVGKG